MTSKEYLRQAYRLDQRIDSDIREMERLRDMAGSVSSPSLEERHGSNRPTEVPFVRCIMRVMELQEKINAEIDRLVALKEQMREVIDTVRDKDEQMVLRCRYIHNMTWEQIGDELYADKSTVRRWHGSALQHVVMPENPVII